MVFFINPHRHRRHLAQLHLAVGTEPIPADAVHKIQGVGLPDIGIIPLARRHIRKGRLRQRVRQGKGVHATGTLILLRHNPVFRPHQTHQNGRQLAAADEAVRQEAAGDVSRQNPCPVEGKDAVPIGVLFGIVRQGVHLADGRQLLLRQDQGQDPRQLRPGGRPAHGLVPQAFRQDAVVSGPVHIVAVPGTFIALGFIIDAPVLFINPHRHGDALAQGHLTVGGKAVAAHALHQPQGADRPNRFIIPGRSGYIPKGKLRQGLRKPEGVLRLRGGTGYGQQGKA